MHEHDETQRSKWENKTNGGSEEDNSATLQNREHWASDGVVYP